MEDTVGQGRVRKAQIEHMFFHSLRNEASNEASAAIGDNSQIDDGRRGRVEIE